MIETVKNIQIDCLCLCIDATQRSETYPIIMMVNAFKTYNVDRIFVVLTKCDQYEL